MEASFQQAPPPPPPGGGTHPQGEQSRLATLHQANDACQAALQEQDTTNKPRGVGFEDSKETKRGPSSTPKGQGGYGSGGVKK